MLSLLRYERKDILKPGVAGMCEGFFQTFQDQLLLMRIYERERENLKNNLNQVKQDSKRENEMISKENEFIKNRLKKLEADYIKSVSQYNTAKKEFDDIEREQVEQNKLIAQLIKTQDQQADVIDYLIEKDDLLGRRRLIYPTIIGEA